MPLSTVDLLEGLIDKRSFAAQMGEHFNQTNHECAVRSACIERIASGVVALAKAGSALDDVTGAVPIMSSSIDSWYSPRHKFVITNPALTPCCTRVKGAGVWGPDEKIGLQAIILHTGLTRKRLLVAEATLALSVQEGSGYTPHQGTVLLARFSTDGTGWGDKCALFVPGAPAIDIHDSLSYLLDTARPEGSLAWNTFSRPVDTFDAGRYLAAALPGLGGYLTDLAKHRTQHAH